MELSTQSSSRILEAIEKIGLKQVPNGRYSFGRISRDIKYPNFLDVQRESYESFLQERIPSSQRLLAGLQQVFATNFPITDARENYILEFIDYFIEKPKYS